MTPEHFGSKEPNLIRKCDAAEMAFRMAEYESSHAVEEYTLSGWEIWPLMRNRLCRAALDARINTPISKTSSQKKTLYKRIQTRASRVATLLGRAASRLKSFTESTSLTADAVLIGHSARIQKLSDESHQYIVDPIADRIEHLGFRCHRWIYGTTQTPEGYKWTDIRRIIGGRTPKPPPPSLNGCTETLPMWMRDFENLQQMLNVRAWDWNQLNNTSSLIYHRSQTFEHWFRQISAKALFVDCWYGWDMYAATLAAKRCNMLVIDIQHGSQDPIHYGYHFWTRGPAGGYGAMPRIFWVWGARTAQTHERSNQVETKALVLGNPWMDKWLNAPSASMTSEVDKIVRATQSFTRRILVTTSKPASLDIPYLRSLIETCPTDWAWIIRVHPVCPEDRSIVRTNLPHERGRNVFIDMGSDSPLYALLRAADWHVTNESTCALEALRFGKPSAIIGSRGADLFADFIEQGMMVYCATPLELKPLLAASFSSGNSLATATEHTFSDRSSSIEASIRELLSGCPRQERT